MAQRKQPVPIEGSCLWRLFSSRKCCARLRDGIGVGVLLAFGALCSLRIFRNSVTV